MIALAIFVSAFLGWADAPGPSSNPSDDIIGIPVMNTLGKEKEPIVLENVATHVRIDAFLAETTLTLTFFNETEDDLESEFVMRMDEGAAVTGFGIDVDGQIVEAVPVEREKALIAFESEVAARIDPGLAEWIDGSAFRYRIYPFAPHGRRTVEISYLSRLEWTQEGLLFRLPLKGYPTLQKLTVDLEMATIHGRPKVVQSPFGQKSDIAKKRRKFEWSEESRRITPGEDLVVSFAFRHQPSILVSEDRWKQRFFAAALPPGCIHPVSEKTIRPNRVLLFWDASFSQENDSSEMLRQQFLRQLLAQWESCQIALVVFRDEQEHVREFEVRQGSCAALFNFLETLVQDGGTDMARLCVPDGFVYDLVLLFSDGKDTVGKAGIPTFEFPTFPVASSRSANFLYLKEIARVSGGHMIDLNRLEPVEALDAASKLPSKWSAVIVDKWREIPCTVLGDPRNGLYVTGQIPNAMHRFSIKIEEEGGNDRTSIEASLRESRLADLFWATSQVELLSASPLKNHEQLLDLGKRFGLITPATSLLVFEFVEQYIDHQIRPPESLPEMVAEYDEEIDALQEDLSEEMEEYWEDLDDACVDWVEKTSDETWIPTVTTHHAPSQSEGICAPGVVNHLNWTPGILNIDVLDVMGTPIPGAVITVKCHATGELRDHYSVTNEDGKCRMDLPEGICEVTVTFPGFQTTKTKVSLTEYSGSDLKVVIQVDQIEECIVVTAEVDPSQSDGPVVSLRPYHPDKPYLLAIRKVEPSNQFGEYRVQRDIFGTNPGFFVDCARHFFDLGNEDLGKQVLSNTAELTPEDAELLLLQANELLARGFLEDAISLLERVLWLQPEYPQSKRNLAFALALFGDQSAASGKKEQAHETLVRAFQLIKSAIEAPWGREDASLRWFDGMYWNLDELPLVLMTELNWIWGKLDRLGAINSCPDLEIPPNWKIPVEADLRIAVTWPDAYADMDLWVVEPTGEISDWTNDQTAIGGIMTNCLGQGFGPEVYTLNHAIDGCYEISSHYWGGFGPTVSGPVPLLVAVFTDFGRPQEQVRFSLIRLEDEDDLIDLGSVLILPEDPLSDQNGDAPEKHRHSRSD